MTFDVDVLRADQYPFPFGHFIKLHQIYAGIGIFHMDPGLNQSLSDPVAKIDQVFMVRIKGDVIETKRFVGSETALHLEDFCRKGFPLQGGLNGLLAAKNIGGLSGLRS